MTVAPKVRGKGRPLARLRLAKLAQVEMPAAPARERPAVFHVFEELYARTVRDMDERPRAAPLVSGNS